MRLPMALPCIVCLLAAYLSAACHAGQASQPQMVTIPAGEFWMGSTAEEREYGYRLDETLHGSTAARRHRWSHSPTWPGR